MSAASQGRRASILVRIMLMSWLVAVLSVGVFAVFMVLRMQRNIRADLEQQSVAIARRIEQSVSTPVEAGRFSRVVQRVQAILAAEKALRYIVLEAPLHEHVSRYFAEMEGDTRTTRWEEGGEPPPPEAGGAINMNGLLPGSEAVWHYRHMAGNGGIGWGRIHLGLSMDSYHSAFREILQNVAISGGIVLIIGVLAAYIAASNLIRPLRALQSFAQKVTAGALNARASINASGEIGDLAESVNRMVESLEQSNAKVRDSMKNQASLREKEILLREIHHRVKNNMQILTSLLRLQARQADSGELRDVLEECEARIRSMGLLHEKLYQSESVSVIDMNGYLRTLTGELMRVHTPAGARREIKLNVHNVALGLDTALPCGLIITELVTNALKYAFPGRPDGLIYVSLGTSPDGECQLTVWDNGVGMDHEFDIATATSLGMRLVSMLTDQLNGRLAFDVSQGTRIEITFRESEYKGRF